MSSNPKVQAGSKLLMQRLKAHGVVPVNLKDEKTKKIVKKVVVAASKKALEMYKKKKASGMGKGMTRTLTCNVCSGKGQFANMGNGTVKFDLYSKPTKGKKGGFIGTLLAAMIPAIVTLAKAGAVGAASALGGMAVKKIVSGRGIAQRGKGLRAAGQGGALRAPGQRGIGLRAAGMPFIDNIQMQRSKRGMGITQYRQKKVGAGIMRA